MQGPNTNVFASQWNIGFTVQIRKPQTYTDGYYTITISILFYTLFDVLYIERTGT